MVCEQKKYRDNINSASLAGLMIGALLFGNLADRYGRKALMISCCIGASIVCFLQEPLSQGSTDYFERVSSEINFVDPQFVELRIFHCWHCG